MIISDDQYIIDGILGEDLHILKDIYKKNYPGVLHFILSMGGGPEDAKDVLQDALVVIYMRAKRNPKFLYTRFTTFLFSVCKILWMKQLRGKASSVFEEDTFEGNSPDLDNQIIDDLILMEKQKLVWKHFKQLGKECQQILQMSFDENSLEMIKQSLGFSSIQYTKNRKTHCKNILVRRIWNSPEYKELKNEKLRENTAIPRW